MLCSFCKEKQLPKTIQVSGANWFCFLQLFANLQHWIWSFKCHKYEEKYSKPVKYDGSVDILKL